VAASAPGIDKRFEAAMEQQRRRSQEASSSAWYAQRPSFDAHTLFQGYAG